MNPEPEAYIAKAKQLLDRGRNVADALGYFAATGRDAYMAAFHAAQAILFARTGRVAKTHGGVRSGISRLAHADARIGPTFATFLANAYRLKEMDDYDVASGSATTREAALDALATAARLVAHAEWLLAQPEPPPVA